MFTNFIYAPLLSIISVSEQIYLRCAMVTTFSHYSRTIETMLIVVYAPNIEYINLFN